MAESVILSQAAVAGLIALLIWAACSDVRSLTIPNRVSLSIALLYPVYVLTVGEPVDWAGGLMVAAACLVFGFLLFAFRAVGGGDAKLLAAIALWAGPELILAFSFITALAGGAMVLGLWLHHRFTRTASVGTMFSVPVAEDFGKRAMPYGVAIAVGGFYVAFTIPGLG